MEMRTSCGKFRLFRSGSSQPPNERTSGSSQPPNERSGSSQPRLPAPRGDPPNETSRTFRGESSSTCRGSAAMAVALDLDHARGLQQLSSGGACAAPRMRKPSDHPAGIFPPAPALPRDVDPKLPSTCRGGLAAMAVALDLNHARGSQQLEDAVQSRGSQQLEDAVQSRAGRVAISSEKVSLVTGSSPSCGIMDHLAGIPPAPRDDPKLLLYGGRFAAAEDVEQEGSFPPGSLEDGTCSPPSMTSADGEAALRDMAKWRAEFIEKRSLKNCQTAPKQERSPPSMTSADGEAALRDMANWRAEFLEKKSVQNSTAPKQERSPPSMTSADGEAALRDMANWRAEFLEKNCQTAKQEEPAGRRTSEGSAPNGPPLHGGSAASDHPAGASDHPAVAPPADDPKLLFRALLQTLSLLRETQKERDAALERLDTVARATQRDAALIADLRMQLNFALGELFAVGQLEKEATEESDWRDEEDESSRGERAQKRNIARHQGVHREPLGAVQYSVDVAPREMLAAGARGSAGAGRDVSRTPVPPGIAGRARAGGGHRGVDDVVFITEDLLQTSQEPTSEGSNSSPVDVTAPLLRDGGVTVIPPSRVTPPSRRSGALDKKRRGTALDSISEDEMLVFDQSQQSEKVVSDEDYESALSSSDDDESPPPPCYRLRLPTEVVRPAVCFAPPIMPKGEIEVDDGAVLKDLPTYLKNLSHDSAVPTHWDLVHSEGSILGDPDRIFGELRDFMSRFLYAALIRCLNTGICRARQSLTLFPPTLAKPWFRLENAKTTELFWPVIQGMVENFDLNGRVLQYKKILTGCCRVRVGWAYAVRPDEVGAEVGVLITTPARPTSTTIPTDEKLSAAEPTAQPTAEPTDEKHSKILDEASPAAERPTKTLDEASPAAEPTKILDEASPAEPIGILYETHCASAHLITSSLHLFGKDVPRVPGKIGSDDRDLMFVDHAVWNTLSFAGVEFPKYRDDFGEGESTECDDSYFLGLDHRA